VSSVSSEYNLVHKRIHRVFSTALAARWSRLLFSKIVFTGRCENMRVGEARGASAPVPPSVGPVLVRSWGGPFFRGSRTRLATALLGGCEVKPCVCRQRQRCSSSASALEACTAGRRACV